LKSGANYIASLTDRDDLRYLYSKVRRFTPPSFLAYLTVAFVKSELTNSAQPGEPWDSGMICRLLREAEDTLPECEKLYPPWFVFCMAFTLSSFRAAAYWKAGQLELALHWAGLATEYTSDGRFRYHMIGCVVGMGYITKIHAQNNCIRLLQRNLESMYNFKEYFPFVEELLENINTILPTEVKPSSSASSSDSPTLLKET